MKRWAVVTCVLVLSTVPLLPGCTSSDPAPTSTTQPPAAVASLAVTPGTGQLTVTWPAAAGASSYRTYYSTTNNSAGANEFTGDSNTADTTCTITGLTGGSVYYVWVRAVNSGGSSDLAAGSASGYSTASSSSGTLDPTFGSAGKVNTDLGSASFDWANAVAIQPDGKVLVAGTSNVAAGDNDIAVVRYNADGSLDASFGTGGKVTTNFGSGTSDEAYCLAIQPDGKIIAAGYSSTVARSYFALARYNTDGTLDAGFGTGGKVTTALRVDFDEVYALALQPDGKIVAAGQSSGAGLTTRFALARYNADGTLDATFGTGGKVTTAFGTGLDWAFSVAVQGDGKIVAGGLTASGGATQNDFALARYNADGTLDPAFGSGGKVSTDFGLVQDQIYSIALQTDGKIVAAGYSNSDFGLARYNTDGTLDATFGTGGKVTTDIGSGQDVAQALKLQADGKIVAAGFAAAGGFYDFALARYGSDGALDTTFGTGGKVTTAMSATNDEVRGIALDASGRVVAAGYAKAGSDTNFAVARYQ